MQYVTTTSTDRYQEMKEKIKAIRPQQYPGQNIIVMANDYIRLANELNNAGEYSHDLTRSMLQGFLHVSDSGDLMGTFKC